MTTTPDEPLTRFQTPLCPDDAIAALRTLSKRGKLPGFREPEVTDADQRRVLADAHGTPFDADLLIDLTPADEGSRVEIRVRLRRAMPLIFLGVLVVTIWPGLPLADAFMLSFRWYERLVSGSLATWMWYIPLTALPAPWIMRSSIKKSRASTREHAEETAERLKSTLNAA